MTHLYLHPPPHQSLFSPLSKTNFCLYIQVLHGRSGFKGGYKSRTGSMNSATGHNPPSRNSSKHSLALLIGLLEPEIIFHKDMHPHSRFWPLELINDWSAVVPCAGEGDRPAKGILQPASSLQPQWYIKVKTREHREGSPLLTVETEANGDSKRGPSFFGSLGSSCQYERFFVLPWML